MRDIRKGEELFRFYGDVYPRDYPLWDSLSNIKSKRDREIEEVMGDVRKEDGG